MTVRGSLSEAKAERARLRAPAAVAAHRTTANRGPVPAAPTLTDHTAAVFRARSGAWAPNTIRNRDDDYRRWIAPALGDVPVDRVDRATVEVWLAEMIAAGASRRAIGQAVATLRVILGAAVEWGIVADNPARRLRLPRPDPAHRPAAERVLGADDLARLFAAAGNVRTETMLRAAGEAGLRRGEITGLRWSDVNLPARRLTITRQVVQERLPGGGHRKHIGPPKGGRSRAVAITATMADRLAAWFAESVVAGGSPADGYVWPGRDGGPMHDRSLARALERACERAGLVANPDRASGERAIPLVSPHRLRHSAASVALAARAPLTVVAAQLGHASPNITATIYAHLVSDADLDLAVAAFAPPVVTDTPPNTPPTGDAGDENRITNAIRPDPPAVL